MFLKWPPIPTALPAPQTVGCSSGDGLACLTFALSQPASAWLSPCTCISFRPGSTLLPAPLPPSHTALPPEPQVCETLDTAAGITACIMWQQAPAVAAAAAAAAGTGGGDDDLLEPLEHRHAKDAGAAAKAGREEAADFARLYRHHHLAGGAVGTAAAASGHIGEAAATGPAEDIAAAHEEAAAAAAAELKAWQALTPAEQLAALIDRLRGRYCYCLYCGCHYDSAFDLQQHCPGPSEADHE